MSLFRCRKFTSRFASLVAVAFILTAFPAMSAPQGTGEKVITNYEVLEKISDEAIGELISNMPQLDKSKLVVLVKGKSAGSIDFVFQNVLISKMMGTGQRVTDRPAKPEEREENPDYELNYQLIRLNMTYPDISRSYWIGSKEVDRMAEVAVFAQLVDLEKGDIIWVGETQKKYEDRIGYSLLDRVEDPQHDFTRPPRNELRWSKLVEPVIVTGIVTGLVYLFFSNQSSSD